MNRTALTSIAPGIFRKRLLIEGFFRTEVTGDTLRGYFQHITDELGLRTYTAIRSFTAPAVKAKPSTRVSTASSR